MAGMLDDWLRGVTLSGNANGGSVKSGPVDMFAASGSGLLQFPLGGNYTGGLGADASYAKGTARGPDGSKSSVGSGFNMEAARALLATPEGQQYMAEWLRPAAPGGGHPDNQFWLRFNTRF